MFKIIKCLTIQIYCLNFTKNFVEAETMSLFVYSTYPSLFIN